MIGRATAVEHLRIPERLHAWRSAPDLPDFVRLLHADGATESLSYYDLHDRAARWLSYYTGRGIGHGDRVVVILQHSADLYAAFMGALLGGIVPAMFAFPSAKLSEDAYFATVGQLLQNAHPRLIVTYAALATKLGPLATPVTGLDGVVTPAVIDTVSATEAPLPPVDPEATAFLQYSSGTTGLKKGVAVSHRALLWQVRHYAEAIALSPDDVIVSWLPLYHDMGLIACLFLPIVERIRLVALSTFDWVKRPASLLQAITAYRGTLCWLPNFSYNFLAANIPDSRLPEFDLSSLRGVVNCSEPILAHSHDVFVRKFGASGLKPEALAASYAMAENTFAVTSGGFGVPLGVDCVDGRRIAQSGEAVPVDEGSPGARLFVSSGRALPGTIIDIVDADGHLLPERRQGEIVLRSPCLLTEYFRNPDDTARSLRDGRYFTGDLGYLSGGELFVSGRQKDMVIVGGQNIYPQDVEALVNQVDGVYPGRVVAFGVSDADAGTEGLVVVAETIATTPEARDRIRRGIFDRVSIETDIPVSDVCIVDHKWLVKSSSGKISRNANRDRYLERRARPVADGGGACGTKGDDLEREVAQVVRRVVERRHGSGSGALDANALLLSSGRIDSLGLASLILEIEQAFGVELSTDVLADPAALDSVAAIARTIASARSATGGATSIDVPRRPEDVQLATGDTVAPRPSRGFWTWYYRALFAAKGIRCGDGLDVQGRILLRLSGGDPRNLSIGRNVTLMPLVDLKVREQGRIALRDGAFIDTLSRLVAANDARIEIGEQAKVGFATVINAGADVIVGCRTLIAASCSINSSDHRIDGVAPIASLGYDHAPVYIGEDCWIGADSFVGHGSRIGRGAVLGLKSVVKGDIPAFAVAMGSPARVLKFRGR